MKLVAVLCVLLFSTGVAFASGNGGPDTQPSVTDVPEKGNGGPRM